MSWNRRTGVLVLSLASTMVTTGCVPEKGPEPPPLEVIVAKPITDLKIQDWDTYTGTVQAEKSTGIESLVRGKIKEILFGEGDEVKAGQVLILIDDVPFQANLSQATGELKTWEAKLKAAEDKIAIYKPLAEKGTVAKEELIQAVAAQGEAIGGKETARGKIMEADYNIEHSTIKAPFAGKIGKRKMQVGDIVSNGPTKNVLVDIVTVDPQYVYFNVTERAYLNFKKKMLPKLAKDNDIKKIILPVQLSLLEETDFPHKGEVNFADIKISENTGTYEVRAVFENPKDKKGARPLIPGAFAKVRVAVSELYAPILVADRAIQSDQNLKYVLIVGSDKKVKRVNIEPSPRLQDDGLRAVDGGLKGDELIIVEGVNRVRPGMTVTVKGDAPVPMPRRVQAQKK